MDSEAKIEEREGNSWNVRKQRASLNHGDMAGLETLVRQDSQGREVSENNLTLFL